MWRHFDALMTLLFRHVSTGQYSPLQSQTSQFAFDNYLLDNLPVLISIFFLIFVVGKSKSVFTNLTGAMTGYEYPYQRVFDGIVYDQAFQPEDLIHIRDELELDKQDVLVSTYPKSGTLIHWHYNDVIMSTAASPITSLTIACSSIYSDADQRKHQSSASLAFVRGIHRGPVNSPHKWSVTRKMFPFDDVIMAKPRDTTMPTLSSLLFQDLVVVVVSFISDRI